MNRHSLRRRLALLLLAALLPVGCGCGSGKKKIRVFAADSLNASFRELEQEFEKLHPDMDVVLDIHGSLLLARIAPVRRVDVVAVADHRLVEKILHPEHSNWVVKFAATEVVLAHYTASKYQDEITPDNWFDILLRPDVKYGIADPAQDPCGYHAHLVWKLAERHYFASKGSPRKLFDQLDAHCPKQYIALDALRLISDFLTINRIDYAFVYKCHAKDLNLPYTPLPREINLGDRSLAKTYAATEANVPNFRGETETITASPIAYGLTIPKDAPNKPGAAAFVRFLLSPQGQAILERSDYQPLVPARVPKWAAPNLPPFLRSTLTTTD